MQPVEVLVVGDVDHQGLELLLLSSTFQFILVRHVAPFSNRQTVRNGLRAARTVCRGSSSDECSSEVCLRVETAVRTGWMAKSGGLRYLLFSLRAVCRLRAKFAVAHATIDFVQLESPTASIIVLLRSVCRSPR